MNEVKNGLNQKALKYLIACIAVLPTNKKSALFKHFHYVR